MLAAVHVVAGLAALRERLVFMLGLELARFMAGVAEFRGFRFEQGFRCAAMRIVAIGAASLSCGLVNDCVVEMQGVGCVA
jgi:hypothetical protein